MRNLHLEKQQDTVTRTEKWFNKAKPKPTHEDLSVQLGCMLEEVCELLVAVLGLDGGTIIDDLSEVADTFKSKPKDLVGLLGNLTYEKRIEMVDACCDVNVTSIGVMTLMGGVDVLGATNEVIRSNDSKIVDGEFIFKNGKIAKPISFSEPELSLFVSDSSN